MESENSEVKENKIVLLTIKNVLYPVNTDIIYRVASRSGFVERIVIFKKKFLQAMVEYGDLQSAKHAKDTLQGKDIYDECNTIHVEYARTQKLNVYKNDSETWDYTKAENTGKKSSGLLGERPDSIPLINGSGYPQQTKVPSQAIQGDVHYNNFHSSSNLTQNPGTFENSNWSNRNHTRTGAALGQGVKNPEIAGNGDFDYNYSHLKQTQPMQEQSSVVMVYGVDPNEINCAKLFNLLCLYGNVLKIKFLKSKPNTAMVQMCTPGAVDRACQWLNGIRLYSLELNLSKSKQLHLIDSNNSKFQLPDSSSSFQDYSNSRNHRFASQKMAKMNRQEALLKI